MGIQPHQASEIASSKRGLELVGLAGVLACVACCAAPLLVGAGIGSGVLAGLALFLRPGAELLVGGFVVLVLGVLTVRNRKTRNRERACGTSCKTDGTCCA